MKWKPQVKVWSRSVSLVCHTSTQFGAEGSMLFLKPKASLKHWRVTMYHPIDQDVCLMEHLMNNVAYDAATEAYMKAVIDIQKRDNTLWCYLAVVLDSTSLMLIRHDCMDNKALGDGRKAWVLLQKRFWNDEIVAVVSLLRQMAHLQLKEDKALHKYFICAQELSTRLEHAGE